MKRLTDLRPSDLERAAVWHYAGETDDVAQVRATDRRELTDAEAADFIARTQFVLANGTQHIGFCSPADEALDVLQPVIVTSEGLVYFHFEEPPSHESLLQQWKRLGVGREQIFPVHFRCLVPLDGRYVTGTIDEDDLTGAA
ncbi:MAG TPA: hypothetical protein VNA69_16260 [Thermoanaerobaculia bacterium]|nr:hypothetical protein [Thermoanaerobaculia bacterium]